MDHRTLELINLELDGRLDDAARAELEAKLADPAVRAHRDQLHAVASTLAQAPAPELPLDFTDSVLRRAHLPQRSIHAARHRRQWRTGLALAASVIVAVVVLRAVEQPLSPHDQLTGAMAPATPTVTVTPLPEGAALAFDLPAGPARIVIDFGAGAPGLSAKADAGVPPRIEGRRIVLPEVAAGRTTVAVTGDVGEFSATVDRDGVVTPVTLRAP